MYCKYYQLNEKPFQITTDPKFLWLGEKHKEALSILKYGILDNKWFLLLTGDVGTGKTTLIHALLRSLDERVIVAAIPDPGLEELDLFNFIADAFKMNRVFASKGEFLIHFKRFLNAAHEEHKKVLLIIDEAQQLTQQRLETIRLLSNIEREETKLINIFFIGQNEFNDILRRTENRALRQRITLNYNIAPLTTEETAAYIAHRLKVARAAKSMFTPEAVRRIAAHSGGYPRLINVLCDYALVTGYVKGIQQIGPDIISECALQLKIPGRKPPDLQQASAAAPQPAMPPPAGPVPPAASSSPAAAPPAPVKSRQPAWLFGFLGALLVAGILLLGYYAGWRLPLRQAAPPASAPAVQPRKPAVLPSLSAKAGQLGARPETHVPAATAPAAARGNAGVRPEDIQATGHSAQAATGQTSPTSGSGSPTAGVAGPKATPVTATVTHGPELPAGRKAERGFSPRPSADSTGQGAGPRRVQAETPVAPAAQQNAAAQVDAALEKRIQALVREKKMVVYFGYDSNEMKKKTLRSLDTLSAFMQRYPRAEIIIRGYTDSSGVYSYNKKLSEFRANMVKSYLVGKGADPDRIETRGLGPENPVQSNQSEKTRKFNRRVEIEIFLTPRAKRTSRLRKTAPPAVSAPY